MNILNPKIRLFWNSIIYGNKWLKSPLDPPLEFSFNTNPRKTDELKIK